MRILVTGAAGYIGSEIIKQGVSKGHEMVGFDNLDGTLYSPEVKISRVKAIKDSLGIEILQLDAATDNFASLNLEEIDVIVNQMAVPGLAPSWEKFDLYLQSNVVALQRLLDAIVRKNPNIRFVHASTSSVYGNTDGTKDLSPISPYGVSKLAAENLIGTYESQFGVEASILRYFSVFGGIQRPDMAYSKFIRKIMQGETIQIFGDGNQVRTNTHVSDVARATLIAAEKTGERFTLDISGKEEISLMAALEAIQEQLGLRAEIEWKPRQFGDQDFSKGDLKLAKEILDWEPGIGFLEGIEDQVEKSRSFYEFFR